MSSVLFFAEVMRLALLSLEDNSFQQTAELIERLWRIVDQVQPMPELSNFSASSAVSAANALPTKKEENLYVLHKQEQATEEFFASLVKSACSQKTEWSDQIDYFSALIETLEGLGWESCCLTGYCDAFDYAYRQIFVGGDFDRLMNAVEASYFCSGE